MSEFALLVIAHPYSTILSADNIVVFDGGVVAAAGTNEELLVMNRSSHTLARSHAAQTGSERRGWWLPHDHTWSATEQAPW